MSLPKQAWGNPLGWTLASVLLLVIIVGLATFHQRHSPTAPTGLAGDPRIGSITLPVAPDEILAAPPTREADAGEVYLAAARGYLASLAARRPYDDFLARPQRGPAAPGELPLLQNLLQAADLQSATLFADRPEALINYRRQLPELDALSTLGHVATKQAGLLAGRNQSGDLAQAQALYEAAFMLGVRLYEERIVHRQMELGYRLMSESLGGLVALARKQEAPHRATRLAEARERFTSYVNTTLQPVWERIAAINDVARMDDLADIHAGDVRAIALNEAADVLWRTEAILRLGKAQHDATRPPNRLAARRTLEHLARTLRDDRLRFAAEQALGLTQAERMIAR